jgi:hypothetical protein
MARIEAPGGWGWVPGTNLGEVEPGDLPELPLLSLLTARQRMRVLRETPFPFGTKPQHLQIRYGVTYNCAHEVLCRSERVRKYVRKPKEGITA